MTVMLLGLFLFLGAHSSRIVAEPWRQQTIARLGPNGWKGAYSAVSLVGLVLIVWGFGLARAQSVLLWMPPVWTRHVASLLVLVAFVLVTAAYVPGNALKAWLHHPMLLGVKSWAFAHLLANGRLQDVVLFGAFLLWAVLAFRAARARDRASGAVYPSGRGMPTVVTVVVGVLGWALFAFWAHRLLFGVAPFGA